jgi:hypothetical protein
MAITATRSRKRQDPPAPPCGHEDLAAEVATLKAENTALARAICALATRIPGGPATARQILAHQLKLGDHAASTIVAAANRAS